jgi:hypothetical protein
MASKASVRFTLQKNELVICNFVKLNFLPINNMIGKWSMKTVPNALPSECGSFSPQDSSSMNFRGELEHVM